MIEFEAYPHIESHNITWNIFKTNFKEKDWTFASATKNDAPRQLNYKEMVDNNAFRVSDDLKRTDNLHTINLFVSNRLQNNEYNDVMDELWLVEMVVKARFSITY